MYWCLYWRCEVDDRINCRCRDAYEDCIQNVYSSHCIVHRHALAVKRMPNYFKSVLDNAVQIVNFIKARPLNYRLRKLLCNDMGSEYETLIFHTEDCWLSRGKFWWCIPTEWRNCSFFLSEKETSLANYFSDVSWLQQLAYLADVSISWTSSTCQCRAAA
jgi:hypothetical protein